MPIAEQDLFFAGLAFEKIVFDYGFGPAAAYKGPDGYYYRISKFGSTYVIEDAETEAMAKLNQFEDADTFDAGLPQSTVIQQVQEALLEYIA